jgi:hypothetical protein
MDFACSSASRSWLVFEVSICREAARCNRMIDMDATRAATIEITIIDKRYFSFINPSLYKAVLLL